MNKYCKKCEQHLNINNFTMDNSNYDKLKIYCKSCSSTLKEQWRHNIDSLSSEILSNNKRNSIRRGHNPPTYDRKELDIWLKAQPSFYIIYREWVESGYNSDNKPSLDRLDESKGYSFDNVRLVTWKENQQQNSKNIKIGVGSYAEKKFKKVYKYSMDRVYIKSYISVAEAQRQENIKHISCVCLGKRRHSGGFIWSYSYPLLNVKVDEVETP